MAYLTGREVRLLTRNNRLVNDTYPELLGYRGAAGRLAYAGKVGTGFDTAALASLHDALRDLELEEPAFEPGDLPGTAVHWVQPKLVGEVAFTEWTEDGQLRHPRFRGLRRDKDASDVVREDTS